MGVGVTLREAVKAHGLSAAKNIFAEGRKTGRITDDQLSIREMAEAFMGSEWAVKLTAFNTGQVLRESQDAVEASAFAAITGQLLIDTIREKYKAATEIGDQIFTVQRIANKNLGTQREPYLSDVTDDAGMVQQLERYPETGFQGQYVDYPAPQKFGRICSVSMEAIYADLTGQIIDSAGSVGRRVGLNVEERRAAVFLGMVNPYSWNGTTYNTYLTSGAWTNSSTSFVLTDWTSINTVEQLFTGMLDPVTGKNIDIEGKDVYVMPAKKYDLRRILTATTTRSGPVTATAGANVNQFESANPLDSTYKMLSSTTFRRVALNGIPAASGVSAVSGLGLSAAVTDTVQVWGDFKKAFLHREVFPVQVVQAPPNNPAEFENDIALRVKANVYFIACVRDPRYVVRTYNSAA